MSEESTSKSIWTLNQNQDPINNKVKANDLVMAWAVDSESREPVYIFELDAAHRGAKCDCLCVSCNMPLMIFNFSIIKCSFRTFQNIYYM